jgi:hypothetical protein
MNFLVRKSTRAFHRCGAFPRLLDRIQLQFVGRTGQKPSDVKKLLIPDWIENSRSMYEEKEDADLPHCDP